jgi:hypothetical protein
LHGSFRATGVEVENGASCFSRGVFSSFSFDLIDGSEIGGRDDGSCNHVAESVVFSETGSKVIEKQDRGQEDEDATADEKSRARLEDH